MEEGMLECIYLVMSLERCANQMCSETHLSFRLRNVFLPELQLKYVLMHKSTSIKYQKFGKRTWRLNQHAIHHVRQILV